MKRTLLVMALLVATVRGDDEGDDFVGGAYKRPGTYAKAIVSWVGANGVITKVGNTYLTPDGAYVKCGNTYLAPDGEGTVVKTGSAFLSSSGARFRTGNTYSGNGGVSVVTGNTITNFDEDD
jgi:hypothetical protein